MDVKSVPKISPYVVNTAAEARDQDRRQNRQEENPANKNPNKIIVPSTPLNEVSVHSSEADITCQIVDSLKIVQMLSSKTNASTPANRAFTTKAAQAPKDRSVSDGKKVNKSF
jgi:ribosomal protein L18